MQTRTVPSAWLPISDAMPDPGEGGSLPSPVRLSYDHHDDCTDVATLLYEGHDIALSWGLYVLTDPVLFDAPQIALVDVVSPTNAPTVESTARHAIRMRSFPVHQRHKSVALSSLSENVFQGWYVC